VPPAALLPPLVEVHREQPPSEAPSAPPVTPRPVRAPTPPAMPTLDLGVRPTLDAIAQPLAPMIAPLPEFAPQQLGEVPGVAPGAPVPTPALLDEHDLDEGVRVSDRHFPPYPPRAQRLGLTDTVVVRFTVHEDGRVSDLELVTARHPEYFREPSFNGILLSRFVAGRKGGVAVSTRCTYTFQYVLP
jgi:protein TonB